MRIRTPSLKKIELDESGKTLAIFVSEVLDNQPVTTTGMQRTYKGLKDQLPSPVANYQLTVYREEKYIEYNLRVF